VAWRQGPQGSGQHLALAVPATRTRTQRPRKYLAVHATELAVEPKFSNPLDDIVDHCCYAWNTLIDQPSKTSCPSRAAIGQSQVTQFEDWHKPFSAHELGGPAATMSVRIASVVLPVKVLKQAQPKM
jgi:hypothetical protein